MRDILCELKTLITIKLLEFHNKTLCIIQFDDLNDETEPPDERKTCISLS